ncbi:DUF1128 domain-containing protein [Pullulanibacillus sp. KACC 23026]|uniref:DUF1128 domain-containing protein n=1 Tax=Pullulanibacillus sp. KACC 23026 TaxID=3028315 RepID=UPI0023B0AEC0|nr:DUF1128 domain-containing protein [Pullulanibacillus sp. KACC 23026]WEG11613.1 DUF1128 domain-containing protein [Pullulanibacillus sp. KACC 23026]
MNLEEKSTDNLEKLIEDIKDKLQLVNRSVLTSESFSLERYEELYEVYKLVMKKPRFSVLEMEGILDELKALRSQ